MKVSSASMFMMGIDAAMGILIPVALVVLLRKKKHCDLKPFFAGWIVFLLFANVLEQIVHSLVLSSSIGTVIRSSAGMMALYGAVMAALFEETGRRLAFSKVLKKNLDHPWNSWMYGAGHGGAEVFTILTIGMITNLVYAKAINSGTEAELLAGLTSAQTAQMQNLFAQLAETPAWMYLFSLMERISAMILQISLSVLVAASVRLGKNGNRYLLAAYLIHFGADFLSVFMGSAGPVWLAEIGILIMALLTAFYAQKVWEKEC